MRRPHAWREVRGTTMEIELIDLVARTSRMNARAKSKCLDSIWATHEHLRAAYEDKLSSSERKAFLRELKLSASKDGSKATAHSRWAWALLS
jgi:hypothetical protein